MTLTGQFENSTPDKGLTNPARTVRLSGTGGKDEKDRFNAVLARLLDGGARGTRRAVKVRIRYKTRDIIGWVDRSWFRDIRS